MLLAWCGPPPDISIHDAAKDENIEAIKQHIAAGADVNAKMRDGRTLLDLDITFEDSEIADLLCKTDEVADGVKHLFVLDDCQHLH